MSRTVTVKLDIADALLIGQTLRALAHSAPATDPTMSARLMRVGTQLTLAARVEEAVDLANDSGAGA